MKIIWRTITIMGLFVGLSMEQEPNAVHQITSTSAPKPTAYNNVGIATPHSITPEPPQHLEIVNNAKDGYYFKYSTSDQSRNEKGQFVNDIWTVNGHVTWHSPDGVLHETNYLADDKGYRILPPSPSVYSGESPSMAPPAIMYSSMILSTKYSNIPKTTEEPSISTNSEEITSTMTTPREEFSTMTTITEETTMTTRPGGFGGFGAFGIGSGALSSLAG